MKKRNRVFVTLECETTAPLSLLRKNGSWTWPDGWVGHQLTCIQAQANRVAKSDGNPVFHKRKKAKRKA